MSAMRTPSKAGGSERNLGLIAACVVAAVFMLLIVWFVIRGNPSVAAAGAGATPETGAETDAVARAPDTRAPLDDIPDITEIGGSKGMEIELIDKEDPTRLLGVLTAASFEPVGPSERSVEQPEAWIHLRDGRFLYMISARGRFFMPAPSEPPESGVLIGDDDTPVRIRLYEATSDGERPDPVDVVPLLTAEFDQPLDFDVRHARVSTTGRFRVFTPEVEFIGTHLTAIVNQVRERLELVSVREGESIIYTPLSDEERARIDATRGALAQAAPPEADSRETDPAPQVRSRVRGKRPAPNSADASATADEKPADAPSEQKIDYYRAVFADSVRVTSGNNALTADALDLWVRLIDNQLPEDAIAQLQFAGAEASEFGAAPAPAPADAAAQPRRDDEPEPSFDATDLIFADTESDDDDDDPRVADADDVDEGEETAADPRTPSDAGSALALRWTGPLEIVPVTDEEPEELEADDIMLRLTAERSGLVEFADAESGAAGRAVSLDYGFTSTELVFSGPGGNVELAMPGSGNLTASRMMTNLRAGTVHVRGPGVMEVEQQRAADPQQRIRWAERADFEFEVENERLTSDLTRAMFAGSVQAVDAEASLEGEVLDAVFVESATGGRMLSQLMVHEAVADDGDSGTLAGEKVVVEFARGTAGHDMDPVRVTATGAVRGHHDGSTIGADAILAELGRDLDGDMRLEHIAASGDVNYVAPDGTFARAAEIEADPLGETVVLRATEDAPAELGQGMTSITGPEILVDARSRTARVLGAGTFAHETPDDAPDAMDVIATWTEGMSFDDFAGRVEAFGAATAESRPDALTRDTVSAERILIELTPFAGGSGESEGINTDRTLIRATAFGDVGADGQVLPAHVESRVYAQDDPSRVAKLFYLEGMQLIADNEADMLSVPGAGKLLILDRERDGRNTAQPEGERGVLTELASAGPGLTRFEWRGAMGMHRTTGTATMRNAVAVRHKSLDAGEFTELRCEHLTAQILETGITDTTTQTDAVRGELTQAEAAGAVYFRSGDRELIADRLLYDAMNARAIATASTGNLVSMFDASRGAPVSSRAIYWDLVRDRIEIERPSPVVSPAGR